MVLCWRRSRYGPSRVGKTRLFRYSYWYAILILLSYSGPCTIFSRGANHNGSTAPGKGRGFRFPRNRHRHWEGEGARPASERSLSGVNHREAKTTEHVSELQGYMTWDWSPEEKFSRRISQTMGAEQQTESSLWLIRRGGHSA